MQLLGERDTQDSGQTKPVYVAPAIPFPESLFLTPRPLPEARVMYMDGNTFPPTIT